MATDPQNRHDRLLNERILRKAKTDLPPEIQAVVEGLTPHEVEVISAVHKRLSEADRVRGEELQEGQLPPYTNFMIF